jgi:hypothetical protein
MKTRFYILLSAILIAFTSCTKEDKDPSELIVGKWNITSSELLGTTVPGNGSYLEFNACSSADTCTGVDYDASDTTLGSFTYTLNSDGSILDITDTMSEGGNYNFTFDVLELTETDMRITAETGIFGNLLMVLSKE